MTVVQHIIKEHQLNPINFPALLTATNVYDVKKQLLKIYKLVYQKARLEQRLIEHKQIQNHI